MEPIIRTRWPLFKVLVLSSIGLGAWAPAVRADTGDAGQPTSIQPEPADNALENPGTRGAAEQPYGDCTSPPVDAGPRASSAQLPAETRTARELECLHFQGQAAQKMARYDRAVSLYERELTLARTSGDHAVEARALTDLGDVTERRKDHERALAYYQSALEISKSHPEDWSETVRAQHQIGDIYSVRGSFDAAFEVYQQALDVAQRAGDPATIAQCYDYLGFGARKLGNYNKAAELHRRALEAARRIPDESERDRALARALNHLGITTEMLAQASKADRDVKRATFRMHSAIGYETDALRAMTALTTDPADQERRGYVLRARAQMYRELSELEPDRNQRAQVLKQSAADASRALSDALAMSNKEWQGLALHELAETQIQSGDIADGAQSLDHARQIWDEIGDSYSYGWVMRLYGHGVYERESKLPEALRAYDDALFGFQSVNALPDIADVYYLEEEAYARMNRPREAIFFGKQAVNTVQKMRRSAIKLDQESQGALAGSRGRMYRRLADLLIDQGRLLEAEQVLGLLKQNELFDYLQRGGETPATRGPATYTAGEAPLAERYLKIQDRVFALAQEKARLLQIPESQRSPADVARIAQLRSDLDTAREEVRAFIKDLDQEFRSLGGDSAVRFGARELSSLETVQGEMEKLASEGHRSVLVHYFVTPGRLRILVTTPRAQVHRDSAITAAQLNQMIESYRSELQSPAQDPRPMAKRLYDVLIAPIAPDLEQAGVKAGSGVTLMLSLDGALRYLPYAALYDGSHWLIEDYSLAIYTAAGRSNLEATSQKTWRVAAMGVSRASTVDQDYFPALPSVPVELGDIVHDDQHPEGLLPGIVRLDAAFTESALIDVLTDSDSGNGYPVLHLATHFRFALNDEDSYLLLGSNQKLTMADFTSGSDFRLTNIDLLALSACDTALGGTQADGSEVEGFGAEAQNRGAKSVLATLWSVADSTTGLFMRDFYEAHEEQHLSKADALRQAQLSFINGAPERGGLGLAARGFRHVNAPVRVWRALPAAPFSHPYFWAPFILMGNWL